MKLIQRVAVFLLFTSASFAQNTPTSATVTIVVAAAPVKAAIALVVSPSPIVGQPLTVTATVTCPVGVPAGSQVVFTSNGTPVTTASLTNGVALCTQTPTVAGSYPLTATFKTTNPSCY